MHKTNGYRHRRTARINDRLIAAAIESSYPRYLQALYAGWSHPTHLSTILHAQRPISVTPKTRARLEKLATLLKFPTDQIFEAER